MSISVWTTVIDGIRAIPVETQIQISSGLPAFNIVGLPDKAVNESRERVRASFYSMGLGLPAKRILVNLAPADLPKEGSHFDLPIALGLMVAMEILDLEMMQDYIAFGELGLNGQLQIVPGVLPTAIETNAQGKALICPIGNLAEAKLSGLSEICAPPSLHLLLRYWKDGEPLPIIKSQKNNTTTKTINFDNSLTNDWQVIKGQHAAKRAMKIAAAGGHSALLIGPPGVGKSLLAQSLPSILPPLNATEALETSLIRSISGGLQNIVINSEKLRLRPFRNPHHSASTASLIGGGLKALPGEVTLAHNGILFLDELPEFSRQSLEALRQPLENGQAVIARANRHISYPARFQLICAMNPCRCGYFGSPKRECSKAPNCAEAYQNKISGPLWDRIDINIDVPEVSIAKLKSSNIEIETSKDIAAQVKLARDIQYKRFKNNSSSMINATQPIQSVNDVIQKTMTAKAETVLTSAANKLNISARSWYKTIKVARTIADLQSCDVIDHIQISEALTYRRIIPH